LRTPSSERENNQAAVQTEKAEVSSINDFSIKENTDNNQNLDNYNIAEGNWVFITQNPSYEITWVMSLSIEQNIAYGIANKRRISDGKNSYITECESETNLDFELPFSGLELIGDYEEINCKGDKLAGKISWIFSEDMKAFSGKFLSPTGEEISSVVGYKQD